jgi:hypothetical protein
MEIGVGVGVRVLLGDARAELDVRAHGIAERLVVGETGFVERLQVQRCELMPLLVADREMTMHLDQMLEAQLAGEAVGPTERFHREPGQVFDVMRLAVGKQAPQQRVVKDLGVEHLLEPVQSLLAAGVLEERRHRLLGLRLAAGTGASRLRSLAIDMCMRFVSIVA